MSDEKDNKIEPPEQGVAATGEHIQGNTSADDPADIDAPADSANAPRAARRGSSALAWIAFLLALVVAGGLAWSVWEQRQRGAAVDERLRLVEQTAGREVPAVDMEALNRRWQGQLDSALGQLRSDTTALRSQAAELARALETVQAQVAQQGAEQARYGASDREAWLLAEVQYLLRMANQRLVMAGDVAAAEGLLTSADAILARLDDVRLHDVRAAVAIDLAAVRAVPRLDVEGIYLRLAALVEQAGKLVIFQLPQQPERPAREPAQTWQGRLRQGYEAALAKLSDYIIIRRRDVPMQALMDPQWEGLVRQNLRMLLEQAQVALLSGNQVVYRESLERAQHWVAEFFTSDGGAARAMSREIGQLTDMEIATDLPDTSRSVQALDAVMSERLRQGGAE